MRPPDYWVVDGRMVEAEFPVPGGQPGWRFRNSSGEGVNLTMKEPWIGVGEVAYPSLRECMLVEYPWLLKWFSEN